MIYSPGLLGDERSVDTHVADYQNEKFGRKGGAVKAYLAHGMCIQKVAIQRVG